MANGTNDETQLENYCDQISKIFDQAQASTSNHRKNHVALFKLQGTMSKIKRSINHGEDVMLIGHRTFKHHFNGLLARTFSQKKGVVCADRVVKFVGAYIRFINEKALEGLEDLDDEEDDEDNYVTRFTGQLLGFLLEGISSKDKSVRYRVLQSIAEMISHLGSIEQRVYKKLKKGLIERISDREAAVRVQAAISLSKLVETDEDDDEDEDEDEDDDDLPSIEELLLQIMAHDPSSEVRRCTLLNIPVNSRTLPKILARVRDTDALIRKSVYSLILEDRLKPDSKLKEQVDFLHPRCLTIEQRETIIRSGLRDRDQGVQKATESLVTTWLHLINDDQKDSKDGIAKAEEGNDITTSQKIIQLISLFFLQSEDTIAERLLQSLLNDTSIFRTVNFEPTYWDCITFEKAFFARVFVQFCLDNKKEEALDAMLPVVTAFAFYIQEAYNNLLEQMSEVAALKLTTFDEDTSPIEEIEYRQEISECILSELLKTALNLDYSDEIGRRKMLELTREMVRCETLSEPLMLRCLDVLRILTNERDLVRLVVQEVQDLRDKVYDEEPTDDLESVPNQDPDVSIDLTQAPAPPPVQKSYDNLSPEKKARVDSIDLRCLSLLSGMLERIQSNLQQNATLEGALKDLIIPSIQRKDLRFRQKGLKCLALYCLIAKDLALKSFPYFMQHVNGSPTAIKTTIMQSLFDMLMMHKTALLEDPDMTADKFVDFLLGLLDEDQDPSFNAVLCKGMSKLMLSGTLTNSKVLIYLVKAYVSPRTKDNQELRQWLSFFLKRYSWYCKDYQQKMREAFSHLFLDVCQDRHEADDDDDEILTLTQLTDMFSEWTDPNQLADVLRMGNAEPSSENVNYAIHIDLAHDMIKLLVDRNLKITFSKEDKRALCQALNRLDLPEKIDDSAKVKKLRVLMRRIHQRSLGDATARNAYKKFEAMIDKKYEKELENCSEEDLRSLEEYEDLFRFVDDLIPWSDDEEEEDFTRKGKKRRSQSTGSLGTDIIDVDDEQTASGTGRANKRARLSSNDDSKRVLPKRAAKTNAKPMQVINLEDYEDTPESLENAVSRLSVGNPVKEEMDLDHDISKLLDPLSAATATTTSTVDSILGADTEDEEDEVSGLLAED